MLANTCDLSTRQVGVREWVLGQTGLHTRTLSEQKERKGRRRRKRGRGEEGYRRRRERRRTGKLIWNGCAWYSSGLEYWTLGTSQLSLWLQCIGSYKLSALNVVETVDRPRSVRKGLWIWWQDDTAHTAFISSKERSHHECEPLPTPQDNKGQTDPCVCLALSSAPIQGCQAWSTAVSSIEWYISNKHFSVRPMHVSDLQACALHSCVLFTCMCLTLIHMSCSHACVLFICMCFTYSHVVYLHTCVLHAWAILILKIFSLVIWKSDLNSNPDFLCIPQHGFPMV